MAKKMLIDATHAEETRVVVVDGNKVEEFDFESENKRQLAGNIYLAKVTRVEPSLQAAFVDYGGNRHGFLAFSEIHPDYYQIPVADREALLEEERAYAEAQAPGEEAEEKPKPPARSRSRSKSKAGKRRGSTTREATRTRFRAWRRSTSSRPRAATPRGLSPMETVAETPVEEPDGARHGAKRGRGARRRSPTRRTTTPGRRTSDDAGDADSYGRDAATRRRASARRRSKDDSIESVADDDDSDDIRPPRKPRPRRYKIQEVIKVRQILLVQVVKEERGNKGAALTTYLSLAGRYCVLMPNTARGGGISRKITNAADRKKLKEIASEIDVPKGAGLIIRTAGRQAHQGRDQARLRVSAAAVGTDPRTDAQIHRAREDLRGGQPDQALDPRPLQPRDRRGAGRGRTGYRVAKDFMKMIMPSHAKNVKHYQDQMPLFARYQVESYLSSMFNPTVQLKSGGYIVIGVTEALVAIDVNSGRATKEGSIEETALKTNLEAAEEIARQLRLRDLAGLIVIDFIDMDERKNNAAVEKR